MWKLGVIADDFTGATDIAGFLAINGVATVQLNGVPDRAFNVESEALVVSLKSRSCPKEQAIAESLVALAWLRQSGCTQIYFKYCSTFDSTPDGNIGPVTDALLEAMGENFTIICPALPVNGRSIYKGYLFVFDELLNESGMKSHPLNPMTDAKISRVMDAQACGRSCNIYAETIDHGSSLLNAALNNARSEGFRYAVLDTLYERHLDIIAEAVIDLPLVTGGSGLAASLARHRAKKPGAANDAIAAGQPGRRSGVVFSGSCSVVTNRQVKHYCKQAASMPLSVERCLDDAGYVDDLCSWALAHMGDEYAPLVYATTDPDEVNQLRTSFPGRDIGGAIEKIFGSLAVKLKSAGVENFIVAGGETSGMVVQSLKLSAFYIGPQIDPGVPWVKAVGEPVCLALKSGNFGSEDFFAKAQEGLR